MKRNILKVLLTLGLVSLSFGNTVNKVYGFSEYNQLSPVENQHLDDLSYSTKKYIDKITNKNLNNLYETKIKKDIFKYLTALNDKITEDNKIILKGLIYKLKQENQKIISQNKYLLSKYSYLLKKYREAHIITVKDLKRLMLKESKHINKKIVKKNKKEIKKVSNKKPKDLEFLFKGQ